MVIPEEMGLVILAMPSPRVGRGGSINQGTAVVEDSSVRTDKTTFNIFLFNSYHYISLFHKQFKRSCKNTQNLEIDKSNRKLCNKMQKCTTQE